MKNSKLYLVGLMTVMLCILNLTNVNASGHVSVLDKKSREAALRIGPEKMMEFSYDDTLHKGNFTNIVDVNAVQQHIADLYPNRPDLYKRAVCTLGKCLEKDGRYNQKQVDKVVKYMMHFSDDCYNREYNN